MWMEQSSEPLQKVQRGDRNKRVNGIRPLTFVGSSLFIEGNGAKKTSNTSIFGPALDLRSEMKPRISWAAIFLAND